MFTRDALDAFARIEVYQADLDAVFDADNNVTKDGMEVIQRVAFHLHPLRTATAVDRELWRLLNQATAVGDPGALSALGELNALAHELLNGFAAR